MIVQWFPNDFQWFFNDFLDAFAIFGPLTVTVFEMVREIVSMVFQRFFNDLSERGRLRANRRASPSPIRAGFPLS